jgi:cold shock CspA family protein
MNDTERLTGRITKLMEGGGYGFIASPEKKFTKIFFHWSSLPNDVNFLDLKKGQHVTFECSKYISEDGEDKGWRATKILLEDELKGIKEADVERIG